MQGGGKEQMFSLYGFVSSHMRGCSKVFSSGVFSSDHFFFFSKPQSTEVQGLLRDQTFCPRWEHVQPACLLLHISLIPSYTDHENPPSVSGRGLCIYRKRLKPSAWKGLQLMAHLSVGFSLLSLLASCIDQLGI